MSVTKKIKSKVELILSEEHGTLEELIASFFSCLAYELKICQGAFFLRQDAGKKRYLKLVAGYSFPDDSTEDELEFGEGLPGQVAKDNTIMNLQNIPGGYLDVNSDFKKLSPSALLIFPLNDTKKVNGVVEVASFSPFNKEI